MFQYFISKDGYVVIDDTRCEPAFSSAGNSFDVARQQCDSIQDCTTFFKDVNDEYFYCGSAGIINSETFSDNILYTTKGKYKDTTIWLRLMVEIIFLYFKE